MLHFKTLVPAAPLIAAAILTRVGFLANPHPCLTLDSAPAEIASAPWHADLHVGFTDNARLAAVRVAIPDNAEVAGFATVDDMNAADDSTCPAMPATQFIDISTHRDAGVHGRPPYLAAADL